MFEGRQLLDAPYLCAAVFLCPWTLPDLNAAVGKSKDALRDQGAGIHDRDWDCPFEVLEFSARIKWPRFVNSSVATLSR